MTFRVALVDQAGWEGGRLYVENLARCLMRLPAGERPELLWLGGDRALHQELLGVKRVVEAQHGSEPRGRLARLTWLARQARHAQCDFMYPYPARWAARGGNAFWLPDLQHRCLPELFSRRHRLQRDVAYRLFATAAPGIVLSSEAVRADFKRFFKLADGRVRVLRFASPLAEGDVDEASEAFEKVMTQLPERYAYVPNQLWRHKDHPTALRAIARIREQTGETIPLVFSGERFDHRHPEWSKTVDALVDELQLRNSTHFLGYLPRAVQMGVLKRAQVIVQPSRFEGWSTVVEDARALGKALVLSDIAPHVEQAPENAHYFPVGDAGALARALFSVWQGSHLPQALSDLQLASDARCLGVARTFMEIAVEYRRR